MSKCSDPGGPAFPFPASLYPDGSTHEPGDPGMTLRDYFAAKAMQGLLAANWCASYRELESRIGWNMVAADAYSMADSMLAKRSTT